MVDRSDIQTTINWNDYWTYLWNPYNVLNFIESQNFIVVHCTRQIASGLVLAAVRSEVNYGRLPVCGVLRQQPRKHWPVVLMAISLCFFYGCMAAPGSSLW